VRLSKEHRLPVILAGQRIFVLLAQKTHLVRLDELVDGGGVRTKLLIVQLDGALILLAAMDGLQLLVALDRTRDLWRGDGQADDQDHGEKNHRQQDEARFAIGCLLSNL
jgi:hypothetical protein